MSPSSALAAIKALHTLVWAFFVACIVAVPAAAHVGRFDIALWAAVAVFLEVLVLLVNRWRCPLTGIAARYTDDRRDNFDIHLPLWLARRNKTVFGTLFALGLGYALYAWWRTRA
ncbi:MAG: hypothetical protein ACOY82_13650 [Pseudomonadota bacterium]